MKIKDFFEQRNRYRNLPTGWRPRNDSVFPCKEKGIFLFFHAFLFALWLTQPIVLYAERKRWSTTFGYADDDNISGVNVHTIKKYESFSS
jgi:hypothetical protein